MKAINELTNEHQGIEIMLDIMSAIAEQIDRNAVIEANHLDGILEFLAGFADKCHHGKEETILFKSLKDKQNAALDKLLPHILDEHEEGRSIIRAFRTALGEYKQGESSALPQIGQLFRQYIALLQQHIRTENEELFPALAKDIDDRLDEKLFEAFEKLEEDVIGLGKHEEYHAMLKQYRDFYISK